MSYHPRLPIQVHAKAQSQASELISGFAPRPFAPAVVDVPPQTTVAPVPPVSAQPAPSFAIFAPGESPSTPRPLTPAVTLSMSPSSIQANPLVQRQLDKDFPHGGIPKGNDTQRCHDFAQKVSNLVDQAYGELISGNVKDWSGAKFATFTKMLMTDDPYTVPHVGNTVEERVYALMEAQNMGLKWTAQRTEGMGGVSRPDIVINLASDREALIDITSDRKHILRKAGGWTTSNRYVYVAEAWFPSITADDLPNIKAAFQQGGIDLNQALEAKRQADLLRQQKLATRQQELSQARELFNQYPSTAAFIREYFKGNRQKCFTWMRANGLGNAKGVPKLKGKRKLSLESKQAMKRKANQAKQRIQKQLDRQILKAIIDLADRNGSSAPEILKYMQANYDKHLTLLALNPVLHRGEKAGLWVAKGKNRYRIPAKN